MNTQQRLDWATRQYERSARRSRRMTKPALAAARWARRTLARRTRVVAVVGTYGKTTTARAVKLALGLPDHPWTAASRNVSSMVAVQLFRQLRYGQAVVEAGIDAPRQMARYARALQPDVTVVTSLGTEHATAFASRDHLREEKAKMVRHLRPGGAAVLNRDYDDVMRMAECTDQRIVTFGLHDEADVRIVAAEQRWPEGLRVQVAVNGRTLTIPTRLFGGHMAYAIAAALAAAQVCEADLDEAVETLTDLTPTPDRLEAMDLGGGAHALLDGFKGSLETIHASLDAIAALPAKRRIVVLGAINSPPNAHACYREVGEHLATVADRVIVVNVTRKHAKNYRSGWRKAGGDEDACQNVADVRQAIDLLAGQLRKGDLVLIKGRGVQKLARVALGLAGHTVNCRLASCPLRRRHCANCDLIGLPLVS